jgi:citrate lyase subunit beta / citryl-CoA lyase
MHPLRSLLFAPGNHARRVAKALTLPADAVILDLEDAVAIAEKPATRALAASALPKKRRGLLYVRVNAMSTEFCYGDLVAVVRPGLDGIILPKAESAAQLQAIDWLLGELERANGVAMETIDLMPIVETGAGIAAIGEIAASGTRVRRLAFGAGDYALDMNIAWTRDEAELAHARAAIAVASRAAGLDPPVDTVWTDLRDGEGLAEAARRAQRLGFQGKMCIHPDQIAAVNTVFTPTASEVERAERVVAAFAEAEAAGSASIQLDGQFIDYPIVAKAQRVLDAIAAIRAAEAEE